MKDILLVLTLSVFLSGCVETVVVGAVTTGVVVASEKSVSQTKDDILIHSKVNRQFKKEGLAEKLRDIDVKVYEGRVILLGKVRKENYSREAIEASWKVDGVKEVIDETKIYFDRGDSAIARAGRTTKDAIITSKIKTKFITKKSVKSINFEVETIDGVVYLMGVAQNRNEIEQSAKIASKVRGVKKVVSHVVLKTDSRRAEL